MRVCGNHVHVLQVYEGSLRVEVIMAVQQLQTREAQWPCQCQKNCHRGFQSCLPSFSFYTENRWHIRIFEAGLLATFSSFMPPSCFGLGTSDQSHTGLHRLHTGLQLPNNGFRENINSKGSLRRAHYSNLSYTVTRNREHGFIVFCKNSLNWGI